MGRVPIGGTDFSTKYYSYDDGEPDPSLKKFALDSADFDYKVIYEISYLNKISEINIRVLVDTVY